MMTPVVMVLIAFSLMALSQATAVYNYPYYVNTGTSKQYRSQDEIGNYQFGYDEGHSSGGTFRKEFGDAFGNKYGSYGLTDADGRYRVVNYVADAGGFRADVKTNEPGIVPTDPASTTINKAAFLVSPAVSGFRSPPAISTIKAPPASTTFGKPLLYAPTVHHSASSEFPLLYQSYYAPYGNYKGTPYTKRSYFPTYKGSPYTKYGYYTYP